MASTTHPITLSASSITGDTVRNPAGENLGEIKDLMIDLTSGQVAYAVLSFGGFMGFGDKLFAVPFGALQLDAERREFQLDVTKEMLQRSHGFDKDHWPDMAEQAWQTEVHSLYNVEPYWQRVPK